MSFTPGDLVYNARWENFGVLVRRSEIIDRHWVVSQIPSDAGNIFEEYNMERAAVSFGGLVRVE